ncbi:hypothetical protein HanIR_Chr04g0191321 [Helianthus annuus]|nr:hypothetical protein HanIR_Chr04g0191321 [Helianthus annuus]
MIYKMKTNNISQEINEETKGEEELYRTRRRKFRLNFDHKMTTTTAAHYRRRSRTGHHHRHRVTPRDPKANKPKLNLNLE